MNTATSGQKVNKPRIIQQRSCMKDELHRMQDMDDSLTVTVVWTSPGVPSQSVFQDNRLLYCKWESRFG